MKQQCIGERQGFTRDDDEVEIILRVQNKKGAEDVDWDQLLILSPKMI